VLFSIAAKHKRNKVDELWGIALRDHL